MGWDKLLTILGEFEGKKKRRKTVKMEDMEGRAVEVQKVALEELVKH